MQSFFDFVGKNVMKIKNIIKKLFNIAKYEYIQYQDNQKLHSTFSKKSQQLAGNRFLCQWEDTWYCPHDATSTTDFDINYAHYLYHTAWAMRELTEICPAQHVDVGSCLRFVSMASAITPVSFYDYRPATITLNNLVCDQADVTQLPFSDSSVESLSCMHVVEHIGLERYGDPFDPEGDLKAIAELGRVLSQNGHLLFVVPVGEVARIQYNAHRIYTYSQIISYFSGLHLQKFSLLLDSTQFIMQASPDALRGQKYACGCFHFIKAT